MAADERAAVDEAVAGVLASGPWIGGEPVERFESSFGAYLGAGLGSAVTVAPHVVGVANGTDAISIALEALELHPGSGVLIAANEGGYSATAARQAGLVPVVMDVDAATGAPTVGTAEAAMRDGVAGIIVTHLHGNPVELAALNDWRLGLGLRLIEDCAQAAGLRVNGRHVGVTGDAGAFSFYPTKNLGAAGDGGAIVFTDAATASRARSLAQYGWGERFRIELDRGRNSRLDSLQAAILRARLPFLDRRNEVRTGILLSYAAALGAALGAETALLGKPAASVAHHAVALSDRRDALREFLEIAGIRTAVHYPHLLGEMPGLALDPASAASGSTPGAAALRDRMLSLPCFPELENDEIAVVTDALKEWTARDRAVED